MAEIIRQRYFEIKGNNFVDRGKSEIVYSKGSTRFWQKVVIGTAVVASAIDGVVVGTVVGGTLGLGITEVFTGKGYNHTILAGDPGYILAVTFLVAGSLGGVLVGGLLINKSLERQGLLLTPKRQLSSTLLPQ